jgi:hypothetical protein
VQFCKVAYRPVAPCMEPLSSELPVPVDVATLVPVAVTEAGLCCHFEYSSVARFNSGDTSDNRPHASTASWRLGHSRFIRLGLRGTSRRASQRGTKDDTVRVGAAPARVVAEDLRRCVETCGESLACLSILQLSMLRSPHWR